MPIWTAAQQTAIDWNGGSLLVSAAAGSGKTAVLTARILRMLTDSQHPISLNRMLVVTFSRAAASELRQRIAAKLTEAAAAAPEMAGLTKQLAQLGGAHISTIHSFCLELIRAQSSALGISPGARVVDETESSLIATAVMEELIDEYYALSPDDLRFDDFPSFADQFVRDRDDRLSELFLRFYRQLSGYAEGLQRLKTSSEAMKAGSTEDYFCTVWGETLRCGLLEQLDYYAGIYREALIYFRDGDLFEKNYAPSFDADAAWIALFREKLGENYLSARQFLQKKPYAKTSLGRGVRSEQQSDLSLYFRKIRDEFGRFAGALAETYFQGDLETLGEMMHDTAVLSEKLYQFLSEFDCRMEAEKKRRGLLEFSDLERYALRLLYTPDGQLSAVAQETAAAYDAVFIDEYQDVNELQDRIFRAISREDRRFFVGDIKQSIYGFRGAAPALFSDYRKRWTPLNPAESSDYSSGEPHTLFLSHNFRCARPIVNFVNCVFSLLFRDDALVPYTEADALVYGREENTESCTPVETVLIQEEDAEEEVSERGETPSEPLKNAETGSFRRPSGSAEARWVAKRIHRMVTEEGIHPGQICILLRSAKALSENFTAALREVGIPCSDAATGDLFENAEVLLMLCVLHCIDNPTKDIYLAGLLKSPIFGMTPEELIRVRQAGDAMGGQLSLYDALRRYTHDTGFAKGQMFLDRLRLWRQEACGRPVDELLRFLYRDTAIEAYALGALSSSSFQTEGDRSANLQLLYEYARRFEGGSFRGLDHFVRYLDDILEQRKNLPAAVLQGSGDAVQIMTIHQSKGLEFPVCFLCGSARRFNRQDAYGDCLLDETLGFTARLRDETGFARLDTPMRRAVVSAIDRANLGEERRVLYVALTRARERLIVTAGVRDPNKVLKDAKQTAALPVPFALQKNASYLKWILTAYYVAEMPDCVKVAVTTVQGSEFQQGDLNSAAPIPVDSTQTDEMCYHQAKALFEKRFAFCYPYEMTAKLPAKLSVSELYPGVLDPIAQKMSTVSDSDPTPPLKHPAFLESKLLSIDPAARGTATHVFMQFCDFARIEQTGVEAELRRLTDFGFMTKEMASLVELSEIKRFFQGKFYAELRHAREFFRELRFNVFLPASDFLTDPQMKQRAVGERILVQGVLDLLYRNGVGEICLLDYKTDHFSSVQRSHPETVRDILWQRHHRQLQYYRLAAEQMTCLPVSHVYLYSFALGEAFEMLV